MPRGHDVIHSNTFLAARCLSEEKNANTDIVDSVTATLLSLADTEPFRFDALAALGGLGRWLDPGTVRAIAARLGDDNWELRQAAIAALGMLGDRLDADTVRAIAARLGDDNWEMRANALETLKVFGDRLDAETVRAIAARLGDNDSEVRGAAIEALGVLGDRLDAETVRAIATLLGDDEPRCRAESLRTLGSRSATGWMPRRCARSPRDWTMTIRMCVCMLWKR